MACGPLVTLNTHIFFIWPYLKLHCMLSGRKEKISVFFFFFSFFQMKCFNTPQAVWKIQQTTFWNIFSYFFQNVGFDISCKLSPKECQSLFSGQTYKMYHRFVFFCVKISDDISLFSGQTYHWFVFCWVKVSDDIWNIFPESRFWYFMQIVSRVYFILRKKEKEKIVSSSYDELAQRVVEVNMKICICCDSWWCFDLLGLLWVNIP